MQVLKGGMKTEHLCTVTQSNRRPDDGAEEKCLTNLLPFYDELPYVDSDGLKSRFEANDVF